jgi:hypothetical protein
LLLLLAGRAEAEFTLWVARPESLRELRAAWTMALRQLVSARARPEVQLERLQVRLVERLQVLAVPLLQLPEQQASQRARRLRASPALRPWLALLRARASRTGSARLARACELASR